MPAQGQRPELRLLGSSGYSARSAGVLGLPFAFAHHFSAEITLPAPAVYQDTFRRSAVLREPHAMIAASVLTADTDAEAQWLALPSALQFLRLRQGNPGLLPTPDEAAAHPYSPQEQRFVEDRLGRQIVGSPATVRDGVRDLVAATGVNELMVLTSVHSGADRLRSCTLLAEAVAPAVV